MLDDDDWNEWPPSQYPVREVATFCLFMLAIIGAIVWVIWKVL